MRKILLVLFILVAMGISADSMYVYFETRFIAEVGAEEPEYTSGSWGFHFRGDGTGSLSVYSKTEERNVHTAPFSYEAAEEPLNYMLTFDDGETAFLRLYPGINMALFNSGLGYTFIGEYGAKFD